MGHRAREGHRTRWATGPGGASRCTALCCSFGLGFRIWEPVCGPLEGSPPDSCHAPPAHAHLGVGIDGFCKARGLRHPRASSAAWAPLCAVHFCKNEWLLVARLFTPTLKLSFCVISICSTSHGLTPGF